MKNSAKILFLFSLMLLGLSSCNKEKQAVKKLEGSWTRVSETDNDESISCDTTNTPSPEMEFKLEFTAYTVGDQETGTLNTLNTDLSNGSTSSGSVDYAISEDGKILTLTDEYSNPVSVYSIISLNENSMELTMDIDSVPITTECTNGIPTDGYFKTVTYVSTWSKD
jgi:hypothetical protein